MLAEGRNVQPLYIRSGLLWEAAELAQLQRFLAAVQTPLLQGLQILDLPVADLYGPHWSITGNNVPDASSTDDAVFLPGRNVLLLAKAVIWCQLHNAHAVALATLGSNPFPDATADFFASYEKVLTNALGGKVAILRPYAEVSKKAVMQLGRHLPLEWTFSCIRPVNLHHCGQCNKCSERRTAFSDAGMADVTQYEREQPCIA